MRKKVGLVVLVLSLFCLMPAWSAGAQEKQGTDTASEVKEISMFHFKSLWLDPWEELMQIYEKETGVKVNSEITGGSSDYATMLKTKIAAKQLPDMFFITGYSQYELFKDYIEPQNDAEWVSFAPVFAKEASTIGGHVIGMPLTVETFGLIYNKDLFAKAGIKEKPSTFEDLVVVVEKLKKINVTPFGTGFGTGWVIGQHFANVPMSKRDNAMQFVQDLKDGKATIQGDPNMREFENIFNLILDNCEANPLTTDHQAEVTMFAQGKVAMMLQGNWKENSVKSINPDMNIGLLSIPLGPNEKNPGNVLSGIPFYISINSQSKPEVKKASKDFLTWMVTSDIAKQFLIEEFQGIPAFSDYPTENMTPLAKDIQKFTDDGKVSMWTFPLWPDGTIDDFGKSMQEYVGQKISFDKMLDNMQLAWNRNNR